MTIKCAEHMLVYYYSFWVKTTLFAGVGLMAFVGAWVVGYPILFADALPPQYSLNLLLGAFLGYQSILGIMALRFINTRIFIFEDGVVFYSSKSTRLAPWHKIGTVKEFPFSYITRIRNVEGETLAYVFDLMKDFSDVKFIIKARRETI